jgi:hypothetical protein
MEATENCIETTSPRYNIGQWHTEQRDKQREHQRSAALELLKDDYHPPKYRFVVIAELRIDEKYQRARSDKKVNALRARFSPNACQPLAVSQRNDGSRYLVDGQHRAAVLQDIGVKEWAALVYEHLTRQDEAAMWKAVNEGQTKPPPVARFKAALMAKEPEAVAINGIVTGAGLKINFAKQGGRASGGMVRAVDALEKIYRQYKPAGLADVLRMLQEAWPDPEEHDRTARVMLLGLAAFLGGAWHRPIDWKRAAKQLGQFIPNKWVAKVRESQGSAGDLLCEQFRRVYNQKLKRSEQLW